MSRPFIAKLNDAVCNISSCDPECLLSGINECDRGILSLINVGAVGYGSTIAFGPLLKLDEISPDALVHSDSAFQHCAWSSGDSSTQQRNWWIAFALCVESLWLQPSMALVGVE
jgi:hypothetical protein